MCQRIDCRHGQHRADAEGHAGRVPHLDASRVHRLRQLLSAPLRGGGKPVPSGGGPVAIGFLPAGWRSDDAVSERRAITISDPIEGREHIGRKAACLGEHPIDQVFGEIAVETLGKR